MVRSTMDNVQDTRNGRHNHPEGALSQIGVSLQCYRELNQSILVWKQRDLAAWKDANEAESEAKWEDRDCYVKLAEFCEEVA